MIHELMIDYTEYEYCMMCTRDSDSDSDSNTLYVYSTYASVSMMTVLIHRDEHTRVTELVHVYRLTHE